MADSALDQLPSDVSRLDLLAVVSENLDTVPDDLPSDIRFVVGSIRAVARRADVLSLCAFFYTDAPLPETRGFGFSLIAHMQDGHGNIDGCLIATNQDANNGMHRRSASCTPAEFIDELEEMHFGNRCAVIWDPAARVATIYPQGVSDSSCHVRHEIASSAADLSQDDVCAALDRTYNDNLKTPSAKTVRLWIKTRLIEQVEDEIERHIKGQLSMFFAGRKKRIKILSQTNTAAGRSDLMFFQRTVGGGPRAIGVLELKVLRGPVTKDKEVTREGLSQGYHYRFELELPFATLALFDVAVPPSRDVEVLLDGQEAGQIAEVRVRRYPLYHSPKAWRDVGGPTMP